MAKVVYARTALTGGTSNALDYISGDDLNNNDMAFVQYGGYFYNFLLDDDIGGSESSPDLIVPDTSPGDKRWVLQTVYLDSSQVTLPPNYISGLALSHAADTEHDIIVAAGSARDATDTEDIVLAAASTKQFDVTWAVGTPAGGFAAGESLPTSGTIHVWLMKRSDTGVVDVMANNHATTGLTPTLPTGYDYKRRIGSYRTNASANIINGDWWGMGVDRTFMFDTPILDVSNATPGTNAVTAALSTPTGVACIAKVNVAGSGTAQYVYLSSLDNIDLAPSITIAPLATWGTSHTAGSAMASVKTNTSSQIRYRGIVNVPIYIATLGWEDSL